MFPWNLFPFHKDAKKAMQQINSEDINKYIQNMMGQMIPEQMQGMMNPQDFMQGFAKQQKQPSSSSKLSSSVFETHDFVYVRIPLKEEEWRKKLRLFHTSNQMIIEHIPEYEDKHIITLPALVKKKGTTAHIKDGILEVKIPKNVDMQFSEVDVTDDIS
ncbi:Hsp20/alpha crystallin family protein [Cytobacillus praedii]|uniref:Hsp20/alpha crystallin family protein n=1 Tax=Cytobacillus praedii TaxID=1742358 RepID=A0A4R1ARY3_9BACI|nr:Hsp20/alpha crystallin family protein [Cytobacillus praedii]MED3553451.1 Hsp20/alpha crystallin family protein [Cytobacillus praedii]TCJ02885.1 Hsp20/alpha crystallin family protein [Cytobacillus praedii]